MIHFRASTLPMLLGLLLIPTPGSGQDGASVFLHPDHWAHGAVSRMEAVGLGQPGQEWGSRSRTRAEVYGSLEVAREGAAREAPHLAGTIRGYMERLEEEFPELRKRAPGGLRVTGATLDLTVVDHAGAVRTGSNLGIATIFGPEPVVPAPGAYLGGLSVQGGRHLAGHVEAGWLDGWGVSEAQAVAKLGPVALWGGRRAIGWRSGHGGGLIFDGSAAFDGGGIDLVEPLVLPGFLRLLGPVRFESFLARLDRNGEFQRPWLWGARGSIAPHPRIGLALTRGAMFGGEGNFPVTVQDVLYVMIGKHGSGGSSFDNQIASVALWARPPVPGVPLRVHLEWGLEDSAGAWQDVPGVTAGAEIGAVPGIPQLSLALDYASFARRCCGNPSWYRHWSFLEGWTAGGQPLGHPLGGNGTEWRLSGRGDFAGARLRVEASGFWRERRGENLYAPDRAGESLGSVLRVALRPAPWLEVDGGLRVEVGDADWSESRLDIGARAWLP